MFHRVGEDGIQILPRLDEKTSTGNEGGGGQEKIGNQGDFSSDGHRSLLFDQNIFLRFDRNRDKCT
jgi:hypothetical protein